MYMGFAGRGREGEGNAEEHRGRRKGSLLQLSEIVGTYQFHWLTTR